MALQDPSLPIHQAAKDGDGPTLSKASKKDLNRPDRDGWTSVHWCAWSGHPEPLEIILRRGANPNKVDIRGRTPLHIAATYGNSEVIELLLEYKANVWSLDDRGLHPAKVAALNRRLECCKILDNIGVYLTAANPDFVKQQQTKALRELEKRMKENQKQLLKKHSQSLPRVKASSKKEDKTAETTFVLQRPGENENGEGEEEGEEDKMVDVSGHTTFRPLPKTTTNAMLNTLSDLAKKPMRIEYPDDLQASNSDPIIAQHNRQRHHHHHHGKAITQLVPLDSEFEMENDSALATMLHSIDVYDEANVLLREKIDLQTLSICSEEDLKSVGLHLGPIKKIRGAIIRRNEVIKNPGPMVDTDL